MALPWASALDVSYVGNHGFNRLRAFQGGANGAVDLNAVDIGAAYLPQNQDPTLGTSTVPGATRLHDEPAAGVPRLCRDQRAADEVLGRVPLDPDVVQPALAERPGVRHELHARPVAQGQHRYGAPAAAAPAARGGRHHLGPRGSGRVRKAEREPRPAAARHQELRGVGSAERALELGQRRRGAAQRLADFRRAHRRLGVPAAGAAGEQPEQRPVRPHLHVSEQRRQREPDRLARTTPRGSSTSAIRGPAARTISTSSSTRPRSPGRPYGSVGLESGRFLLGGCPDQTVDLAIARNIRLGGNRTSSSASTRSTCSTP